MCIHTSLDVSICIHTHTSVSVLMYMNVIKTLSSHHDFQLHSSTVGLFSSSSSVSLDSENLLC